MSRISKKKFWEALKKEPDHNTSQLLNGEWVEGLYDEGEWLKGYKLWKKLHNANNKRTDS